MYSLTVVIVQGKSIELVSKKLTSTSSKRLCCKAASAFKKMRCTHKNRPSKSKALVRQIQRRSPTPPQHLPINCWQPPVYSRLVPEHHYCNEPWGSNHSPMLVDGWLCPNFRSTLNIATGIQSPSRICNNFMHLQQLVAELKARKSGVLTITHHSCQTFGNTFAQLHRKKETHKTHNQK